MAEGSIYVMLNASIPGLAKVGRTTRTASERVAELSSATGVATPFVLAYEQAFDDCVAAERTIHAALDRRGLRVAANREFFRGPPAAIIHLVQAVARGERMEDAGEPPRQIWRRDVAALLRAGDDALIGRGETLQDLAEAGRLYRQAAEAGSLVAIERLAGLARHGGRAGQRRSLRLYRRGAGLGNYYCYEGMAALYAAEGHAGNAAKSWDLLFAARARRFCAEAERPTPEGRSRLVVAALAYAGACIEHGWPLAHAEPLQPAGAEMARALVAAMAAAAPGSDAQFRHARVLRLVFERLLARGEGRLASAAEAAGAEIAAGGGATEWPRGAHPTRA